MRKRRTTETLIEEIKEKFGDKYRYDEVDYQGMKAPVILLCVEHDHKFEQQPVHILRGNRGCKYCSGRGLSTEDFINNSKKIFKNNEFDYSKTFYKNNQTKAIFICNVHKTEWEQLPQNHLRGFNPCQDCNGQKPIDREMFIKRSKEKFGENRFDYSKVAQIKGIHTKVILVCVKHDQDFIQEAWSNLKGMVGCPECNFNTKLTPEKIKEKALLKHRGKIFDYSKVDWSKSIREKQLIGCHIPEHGFYEQTFDGHLTGKTPCKICDKQNRLTTLDEFIERVKNIHGTDKYDFDKTVLTNGVQGDAVLKCVNHDEYFSYDMFRILQGLEGCSKCRTSGTSKKEKELADFVEHELGFSIERNYRKIDGLSPKEVDIFIPSRNIAIEFNGLYWHSELYLDKNYHYDKWEKCADTGVRLLTVWEDEWENKQDIVKSHIRHVLGLNNDEKIYARNTVVKPVNKGMAQLFLNDCHIQGFVGASVHIGLFDKNDDELVAVGSFLKSGDNYNLVRFATSCSVVGGFSKLINYFEKNYEYEMLVTFADLGFSDGALYEKNGFVLDKVMAPDYSYIMRNMVQRFHKFGFRKERFKKDPLLLFDESLSERQLAELNGLERIYDCGKLRYVKEHLRKVE